MHELVLMKYNLKELVFFVISVILLLSSSINLFTNVMAHYETNFSLYMAYVISAVMCYANVRFYLKRKKEIKFVIFNRFWNVCLLAYIRLKS